MKMFWCHLPKTPLGSLSGLYYSWFLIWSLLHSMLKPTMQRKKKELDNKKDFDMCEKSSDNYDSVCVRAVSQLRFIAADYGQYCVKLNRQTEWFSCESMWKTNTLSTVMKLALLPMLEDVFLFNNMESLSKCTSCAIRLKIKLKKTHSSQRVVPTSG